MRGVVLGQLSEVEEARVAGAEEKRERSPHPLAEDHSSFRTQIPMKHRNETVASTYRASAIVCILLKLNEHASLKLYSLFDTSTHPK